MQINIYTHGRELLGNQIHTGDTIDIGQGVSLTYEGTRECKAVDFSVIIMLSASYLTGVASGVVSGLIANWLWEKLRGKKVAQIEIDDTIIGFSEGEIKRVIREKTKVIRENK